MKKLDKDTALITIDGGKFSHWSYISCENGAELPVFEFGNNRKGLDKLYSEITGFMRSQELKRFTVGYESTGSYLRPLISFLKKKGAHLIQINPKHTKRVKEITDNSPNKTDKKDPIVIAQIIRLGNGLSTLIPEGKYADLRNLIHERERCIKDRTRCLGRIEALLAEYFPEFLLVMKGVTSKTSAYLLRKYTTPSRICELSEDKLTDILYTNSRYQLGRQRAKDLLYVAKQTIGISDGIAALSYRVKLQIGQLDLISGQLDQIEKKIISICKSVSYSKYINSIKGIGWISTAYILGELGNLSNFKKASQIIKIAGLNLYEISSGQHRGRRRITKIGRGLLRKILYYTAMRTVKTNGVFHAYYSQCLSRGKLKKTSLVIVMKKIIHLLFALVREERFYSKEYLSLKAKQAA